MLTVEQILYVRFASIHIIPISIHGNCNSHFLRGTKVSKTSERRKQRGAINFPNHKIERKNRSDKLSQATKILHFKGNGRSLIRRGRCPVDVITVRNTSAPRPARARAAPTAATRARRLFRDLIKYYGPFDFSSCIKFIFFSPRCERKRYTAEILYNRVQKFLITLLRGLLTGVRRKPFAAEARPGRSSPLTQLQRPDTN
ncbi:hypothetical protein EVAR_66111_1 [Eumeta japonica]|uniref:Uncharacterized protein n=1 Tax=Eumeta variegata TaxID=151549 RepID=A0A4C2AA53_EUMVA|nr:hypothetical protein EVAR_66111_1 [Eumeta japonica]